MEKRSILICPWGKFDNWDETTYYYKDYETENTRSTLKIMHEITEPDRTVIFVQDTIVTNLHESYLKLCEDVESKTYKFITDHKLIPQEMNPKNLLVKILPGVGNYSTWIQVAKEQFLGEFDGSMEPISIIIFQQLFQEFYSLFQESSSPSQDSSSSSQECSPSSLKEQKLEIYLDLTHGMNILPVMVYKIVGELSQLFAMVEEVSLKVYISEPYIRGNENIKLQIHEIEDLKFEGFIPRFEFTDGIGNMESKELNAFISSIHFGFPLLALYTFPKQKELESIIEEEIQSFRDGIEIKSEPENLVTKENSSYKKIIVKHTREIHQELYKLLIVYAYVSLHRIDIPAFKNGISIQKLYDLSKKIYSNNTICNLIKTELLSSLRYNIARNASNLKEKCWISYAEIINEKPEVNIQKRNFSAHIGLERNTFEIFIDSLENYPKNKSRKNQKKWIKNSAKIRYRDDKIGKIYETAESILNG